jgi:hypothetical protein
MKPIRSLLLVAAFLSIVAACSAGAGPTPSPTASPGPVGPVTTPEGAFARVVATEPRLAGVAPFDDQLIGQSSWYRAEPAGDGFTVEVYVGWGDRIAGCIEHHGWTFDVARDGSVELTGEDGSPVPATEWPSPAGSGKTGIFGMAFAGPVCPVEQPDDPACAARPVEGATVLILDADGAEIATAATDAGGLFFVELPAGTYAVAAQPVEGLMANPAPVEVEVTTGEATVELPYDTGIR